MSISLFASQLGIGATGINTLVATGNYALTDIYVWLLNATPSSGFFTGILQCGGQNFHSFGFLQNSAVASNSFGLGVRTFPDGLILPRGNPINLNINQFSSFSGVNVMLNISGTAIP